MIKQIPTLEYTMSGCSFIRITYPSIWGSEEHRNLVKKFFNEVNGVHGHHFSLLYNAYTESSFGNIFKEYADSIYNVHADSGGLQLVTQGLTITPEMRKDIYRNQAMYSDIGMSFDEIPLITIGGRSKRNDMSTRFFDRDNLNDFAKRTGDNVREQIETFIEGKSNCRPFFIVHGNDVETALRWTDVALKQIPEDMRKLIGGIAMGGGTFGAGQKEALLRSVIAGHIIHTRDDIDTKKIHFLGLGSLNRAFSFVALVASGMYTNDFHISYDSTTHSSGHIMGQYLHSSNKLMKLGKVLNNNYRKVYDDILSNIKWFDTAPDLDVFFKSLNSAFQKNIDEGGDPIGHLYSNLGCSMSAVKNFTRKIEMYCRDFDSFLEEQVDTKDHSLYMSVSGIKTLDDYKKWDSSLGRYFVSKKVQDYSDNFLDC